MNQIPLQECWEIILKVGKNIYITDQRSRNCFLEKYDGLSLYEIDLNKRYTITNEYISFVKKYVYALIGNPDHPNVTSNNHEYFIIHDDLFDKCLATDHNTDIALKVTPPQMLLLSGSGLKLFTLSWTPKETIENSQWNFK